MRCAVMNDALVPPEDAEGQAAASEFMEPAVGRRRGINVDGLHSLVGPWVGRPWFWQGSDLGREREFVRNYRASALCDNRATCGSVSEEFEDKIAHNKPLNASQLMNRGGQATRVCIFERAERHWAQ